ncbi:MAG: hypothetical protein AAF488_13515 [Planctomycetota bacterium]
MTLYEIFAPDSRRDGGKFVVAEWSASEGDSVEAGQSIGLLLGEAGLVEVATEFPVRVVEILVDEGSSADPAEALVRVERLEPKQPGH